jgi:hypothetical protein
VETKVSDHGDSTPERSPEAESERSNVTNVMRPHARQ